MSAYDEACRLAEIAHHGQRDKGGSPYINHPLRVSLRMTGETARVVAVLHDTVEDSSVTLAQIERMFGGVVSSAVDALTRRDGEDYAAFIERCKANPIARRVKIEDLHDNMDTRRLPKPLTKKDRERLAKYQQALAALT